MYSSYSVVWCTAHTVQCFYSIVRCANRVNALSEHKIPVWTFQNLEFLGGKTTYSMCVFLLVSRAEKANWRDRNDKNNVMSVLVRDLADASSSCPSKQ